MMSIITENMINQRSATTALLVDSVISPHLQELATQTLVSEEDKAYLDMIMLGPAFVNRFPYLDIWQEDGTIAYSNSSEIIGEKFPPPPGIERAMRGEVVASFSELGAEEHTQRHIEVDYSEVYIPIYRERSDTIIAVAETHELTAPLEAALLRSTILTSLAVLAAATIINSVLFGIVRRGSQTIEAQKTALKFRLKQTEALATKYQKSRQIARNASKTATEIADRYLRNLQAELHDGPLQLMTLAMLNLEFVAKTCVDHAVAPRLPNTCGCCPTTRLTSS